MPRRKLLILGGTTEGSALARALAGDARVDATLSLAGVTRAPAPSPLPLRTGGFGGAKGLAAYLRAGRFDGLVDATHPYAATITRNALLAAALAGVAHLRIARPPWHPAPGDRWTEVATLADAAARLGPAPRRVLLTIGRKELSPFRDTPAHRYVLRSVDPPDAAELPGATIIAARGPFTLAGELDLLRRHRIGALVTKNSGGTATAAKLDAARTLGVDVLMLARPPQESPGVPDVAAALAWIGLA